jgi:hypothetical protein
MTTPSTRAAAAACIRSLYGFPGSAAHDTPDGVALLVGTIRTRGLAALSDTGILALANAHMELEQQRLRQDAADRAKRRAEGEAIERGARDACAA